MGKTLFAASIVALIASVSMAEDELKLLLSVEVCRHGERAPGYIFDFTVDPS